jgi:preprotein translocase subunit SecB
MDKSKQPGISFDDIILRELVFSRKEGFSDRPEFDVQLESNISLSPEEDKLIYEMSCKIKDKKGFFNIKCTMIGFFSVIEGKENMGLKEYSNLSAPAAIFPYIRETIASTTTRAGIPPIIIPPVNLTVINKITKSKQPDTSYKALEDVDE